MEPECGKCLDSDCRGFSGYTNPECIVHGAAPKITARDVRALRDNRDYYRNAYGKASEEAHELRMTVKDLRKAIARLTKDEA